MNIFIIFYYSEINLTFVLCLTRLLSRFDRTIQIILNAFFFCKSFTGRTHFPVNEPLKYPNTFFFWYYTTSKGHSNSGVNRHVLIRWRKTVKRKETCNTYVHTRVQKTLRGGKFLENNNTFRVKTRFLNY